MIQYEGMGFDVFCDKCSFSQTYFLERDEWNTLMQEMRDDGWRSRKVDGEWQHTHWACNEGDSP